MASAACFSKHHLMLICRFWLLLADTVKECIEPYHELCLAVTVIWGQLPAKCCSHQPDAVHWGWWLYTVVRHSCALTTLASLHTDCLHATALVRWLHDVPVAAQCFAPKQPEEVQLLISCFHPQVRSCIKCDTADFSCAAVANQSTVLDDLLAGLMQSGCAWYLPILFVIWHPSAACRDTH